MPPDLDIVAINTSRKLALSSDDTICTITDLIDSSGGKTEDADEAVMAVVRYAADVWFSVDLANFEKATN